MDNINNKNPLNGKDTASSLEQGRWVAVDANELGFQLNGAAPNQPIQGPDGATYCVSESQPQLSGINANSNYAIPTPSSIVQMPPIVQPIALVPYTSQNQPLLQYDPYSRPVEPKVEVKAPSYVKKPYRGISLVALILAFLGLVSVLLLSVASFKANSLRVAFNLNGIDSIKSILASLGISTASKYYNNRIMANEQQIPADTLSTIITYALPILVVIVMLIFVILIIKYIYKLSAKKSPRAFSFGAFINIILCLSIAGILLGMSNAETAVALRSSNISRFFTLEASIVMGVGLVIAFVLSIVLFILPFFARKNAYMLEKEDDAGRTFIIKD